ncbi:mechanosensitive ion channel domain-containing protein [Evansella sp. AB-rgal1]|uniref:mechanosensitive ion channel domain-containing protein n=1 Tax=Evansella sp. AB-rgal1 TaxID=3242696 RepID=UPI00359DAE26
MQEIITFLNENPIIYKFFISIVIFLIYIKLISFMNKLLFKVMKGNNAYYTTRNRLYYLHIAIMIVIIIMIWSEARLDLTIYIGFISAGIAIALREIFTNIAALLIILVQKPFEVGDRIFVNNSAGDVIDQKIFHFVVMEVVTSEKSNQSTGKVVHIPNNFIFLHPISNANKGFEYIWNEIEVRVTMDSDWAEAKEKFETILIEYTGKISEEAENKLREASVKYLLHYQELTPSVFISLQEGHIKLTLRYLSDPREVRTTEDFLWKQILQVSKDTEKFKLT